MAASEEQQLAGGSSWDEMTDDERQLFGDYSPYRCDRVARWWIRDNGCSAVEAGLIRPRSIRLGVLKLAQAQGAQGWYRTLSTGREWLLLEDTSEWHRQIEVFAGYIEGRGGGEGELIVCRQNLDPNDANALRHVLVMFDTATVSDVLLWASQPETDPCARAFIAPSWVEPIRLLLRKIVHKEEEQHYSRLRNYMRFSAKIEYVIRGVWGS